MASIFKFCWRNRETKIETWLQFQSFFCSWNLFTSSSKHKYVTCCREVIWILNARDSIDFLGYKEPGIELSLNFLNWLANFHNSIQLISHAWLMFSKMEDDNTPCCSLEIHRSVENVAGSPSLVLHIGTESNSDFCAVVITGNPGMIEFYEIFMLHLHKASNCHLQVMGISQAGRKFYNCTLFYRNTIILPEPQFS